MNRRGSLLGYDLVIWLIRMVILVVMIVIYLMFSGLMFRTDINVKEGEAYLMMQSLMTTPGGFSYTGSGRTYPGIIDMERFNEANLGKALHLTIRGIGDAPYPDNDKRVQHWGYRLSLFDESKTLLKELYWNQWWFDKWRIRAKTGLGGSASAIYIVQNYTVQLRYQDSTETGFLKLEVARPAK